MSDASRRTKKLYRAQQLLANKKGEPTFQRVRLFRSPDLRLKGDPLHALKRRAARDYFLVLAAGAAAVLAAGAAAVLAAGAGAAVLAAGADSGASLLPQAVSARARAAAERTTAYFFI